MWWRRILGIIVGWLAGGFLGIVIWMVLFFGLKRDGMLDADGQLTMVTVVASLLLGIASSYLSGALARFIGKDKQTTLLYLGIGLVLAIYSIVTGLTGKPPEAPKVEPNTPQWALDMAEVGMAYATVPMWYKIGAPLLNLVGLALGGFNKGDFDKSSAPAPTEPPAS